MVAGGCRCSFIVVRRFGHRHRSSAASAVGSIVVHLLWFDCHSSAVGAIVIHLLDC